MNSCNRSAAGGLLNLHDARRVWLRTMWLCLFAVGLSVIDARQVFADPRYTGSKLCYQCHSANPNSIIVPDFCEMNESEQFEKHDRHARSYDLLKNSPLTQPMLTKLKIGDLNSAQQCLSCHADWRSEHGEKAPPSFERGVSCEACHGPSSEWESPHNKADTWRLKSGDEKNTLGMFDVRNPVRKAELCISCHVGDKKQGKFITHAMYAAGHPPLPSFDLATMIDRMPKHWRTLAEKGDFRFREQYEKLSIPASARESRDLIVGGIVSFRASLQLLIPTKDFPNSDFAQYDCQACHHELTRPSWRLTRESSGTFGRLRVSEWSSVLAEVGLATVQPDSRTVPESLRMLDQAFEKMPFGDTTKLNEDSFKTNLSTLLKQAEDIAKQEITSEEQILLHKLIVEKALAKPVDYHSARQLTWGLQAVERDKAVGMSRPEFAPRPAMLNDSELIPWARADLKAMHRWRSDTAKILQEIDRRHESVDRLLHLRLYGEINSEANADRGTAYLNKLSQTLNAIGDYKPRSFRDSIRNLELSKE